jgi:hypothetical protein
LFAGFFSSLALSLFATTPVVPIPLPFFLLPWRSSSTARRCFFFFLSLWPFFGRVILCSIGEALFFSFFSFSSPEFFFVCLFASFFPFGLTFSFSVVALCA